MSDKPSNNMEKLDTLMSMLTQDQREKAKVIFLRDPKTIVVDHQYKVMPYFMEADVYFNVEGVPLTAYVNTEGMLQIMVTDLDDPNRVLN